MAHLKATKLSTVSPEPVEWMWPDRIPQGKLVVIGGDPGLGKSQLTMDVVARVTTGKPWPDGNGAPLGNALVLNAEDDAADTIRPRIDAMGGDHERVWVIDGVQDASAEARHLSLHNDLAQLREGIREHQASLVIVDPLTAYLDGADTHKDSAVRPAVTALNKLAMKTGVTVSVSTIRRYRLRGLPHIGEGRCRRYHLPTVLKWFGPGDNSGQAQTGKSAE